jgi:RNA polymerase sigma-70 factor (ECF subfamily)
MRRATLGRRMLLECRDLAGEWVPITPTRPRRHSVSLFFDSLEMSQTCARRGYRSVTASTDTVVGIRFNEAGLANGADTDLETIFCAEYKRIARVIARVTRDPARAEELAVEVFLKWARTPNAQGEHAAGWLYRTAVRTGLKELRSEMRRSRYERLFALVPTGRANGSRTPEDVHAALETQKQVRVVLSVIPWRQSALLLLRHEGLSYLELAATLHMNPASIGTQLARAQQAFRKEFGKRYGDA